MRLARSLWRAARVGEHLATGALIALYVSLRAHVGHPPVWLPKVVRWWHGRLYRALGVRLVTEGRLEPNCLLIGNHISWLDIPLVGAQGEIGFLSKSDVRGWPLIGWMAGIAGTRFIARGAHQSEQVLAQILADLSQERSLMIFPEGTTTDGCRLSRFHPRLFALAQHPGIRIQPVAISYRRSEDFALDTQVPYVGEDTLIANLWRLMRHPGLVACLQFLPPIQAAHGERRRALAERTQRLISEALGLESLGVADAPGPALEHRGDESRPKAVRGLDPQPA